MVSHEPYPRDIQEKSEDMDSSIDNVGYGKLVGKEYSEDLEIHGEKHWEPEETLALADVEELSQGQQLKIDIVSSGSVSEYDNGIYGKQGESLDSPKISLKQFVPSEGINLSETSMQRLLESLSTSSSVTVFKHFSERQREIVDSMGTILDFVKEIEEDQLDGAEIYESLDRIEDSIEASRKTVYSAIMEYYIDVDLEELSGEDIAVLLELKSYAESEDREVWLESIQYKIDHFFNNLDEDVDIDPEDYITETEMEDKLSYFKRLWIYNHYSYDDDVDGFVDLDNETKVKLLVEDPVLSQSGATLGQIERDVQRLRQTIRANKLPEQYKYSLAESIARYEVETTSDLLEEADKGMSAEKKERRIKEKAESLAENMGI